MSVLKPIKDNGTVQISVKIPSQLRDRANNVKDKLKAKGFTIDISEAAVAGIKRLVKTAEKELKELEAKKAAAPATSPKLPQKSAATQKSASA